MKTVTIYQAKTHLAALLSEVDTSNNLALARLSGGMIHYGAGACHRAVLPSGFVRIGGRADGVAPPVAAMRAHLCR